MRGDVRMQEEENESQKLSRKFLEGKGRRNGTSQGLVQVSLWGLSHHSAFPCDCKEPKTLNLVLGNATGEGRQQFPKPCGGAWKGITSS